MTASTETPLGLELLRLAKLKPDLPAITCDGQSVTRGELERRIGERPERSGRSRGHFRLPRCMGVLEDTYAVTQAVAV